MQFFLYLLPEEHWDRVKHICSSNFTSHVSLPKHTDRRVVDCRSARRLCFFPTPYLLTTRGFRTRRFETAATNECNRQTLVPAGCYGNELYVLRDRRNAAVTGQTRVEFSGGWRTIDSHRRFSADRFTAQRNRQ